jgi:adenine-specific DNA methylase
MKILKKAYHFSSPYTQKQFDILSITFNLFIYFDAHALSLHYQQHQFTIIYIIQQGTIQIKTQRCLSFFLY